MCGVIGIFEMKEEQSVIRGRALKMTSLVRHRGPDWSGIFSDDKAILCHERLSIVDVEHGAQPLYDIDKKRVLAVNGEIYTDKELRKKLKKKHTWQTKSDCEVLLYLYDEFGPDFLDMLDGIFAFVLYDQKTGEYFVARDHLGIIPLYVGWDAKGQIYFASEMKALDKTCDKIEEFPPGHYYLGSKKEFVKWYNPTWAKKVPTKKISLEKLRTSFETAVKRQMMCDVPYGVLISGGLDSSLVAAIVAKYRKKRVESGEIDEAWWPQLHSFSIGLEDSTDTKYAKKVAAFIGTVHHDMSFTLQEGMDAISDAIYHLETFDVTSIRTGTALYLLSRKIKAMGIKMVLSGEGADEVFGGYLYFHKAPSAKEFHEETVRKVFDLSKYDCLRANKATAAWGLELRVPFLDKDFLDVAMSIDPKQKMCTDRIEKDLLRRAFAGYLPEEVLHRQKEQFSDGVGYSWIDSLKKHVEELITDEIMAKVAECFPQQTPTSKEQYYYRMIFDSHFTCPSAALTVPVGPSIACSSATAFRWSEEFAAMDDQSGRAVKSVHKKAMVKV
jgi:asparagine synthase (glutamine-hydrolysing)